MTDDVKAKIWYGIALVFTIWFVLTCAVWTYAMNLFFSYPAMLLALLFRSIARRYNKEMRIGGLIVWWLKFGVCFSITMLLLFVIFDK